VIENRTSLRDPEGHLFIQDGHVLRRVGISSAERLQGFLGSTAACQLIDSGRLVRTNTLNIQENRVIPPGEDPKDSEILLEHERIPFPSYPYEWPPEMLYAAGCLTLEIAETLLAEGMGIKDASPFNVLFRGPNPVFVDLLSFERRDPRDPVWKPWDQFKRTFLLPLLVNKYFDLGMDQIFMSDREGIEPEKVYRLGNSIQRFRPQFLWSVTLPTWLGRRHRFSGSSIYGKSFHKDPEKAQFILSLLFKRLRRQLKKVAPSQERKNSLWSNYLETNSYSGEEFAQKSRFVEDVLREYSPRWVLDVGCNKGYFSSIAARCGASVVAIDKDPVVTGMVWRMAQSEQLDILPLVINFGQPSPATGWRNGENPSFLDRAQGTFDAVMMLAVIHHFLVREGIPLFEIIHLLADLTTDFLLIEYISPDDPMFKQLVRGREDLFKGLTPPVFESACQQHFVLLEKVKLKNGRRSLYLMRKKGARIEG
jgi:cyclopropane fatty-acyl-phospholipid synthase-like methyltransferase